MSYVLYLVVVLHGSGRHPPYYMVHIFGHQYNTERPIPRGYSMILAFCRQQAVMTIEDKL